MLYFKLNKLYVSLFFILSATLFLSIFKQYELLNVVYITFFLILFLFNHKAIYFLYFVFLPTNGFISTEHNFLGIFHTSYTVNLFTTIAIFSDYKYFNNKLKVYNPFSNLSRLFIIFIFLYLCSNNVKDFFMGSEIGLDLSLLITRTIKMFILFFPLYYFSFVSNYSKYREIIFSGFSISTIIIAISTIFSFDLINLGIHTTEMNKDSLITIGNNFIRRSGVFAFGDENSVAGFLSIASLILFSVYSKNKQYIKFIILFVFIVLAIVATGSRAGFLCLLLSSLSIIFQNRGFSYKFFSFSFVIIMISSFYLTGYFNPILERFLDTENLLDSSNIGGRVGGWIFYIDYILSNFKVLFLGSWENIYDITRTYGSYGRVAHNFFITLVYKWGILPLFLLIYFFKRYIQTIIQSDYYLIYFSILLQFIFMLMTLSDIGVFFAFIPVLILSKVNDGIYNG